MTKEEAIKILEEGKQDEYTRYQFETCLWTAVDMAIEALKEQKTGKWIDGNRRQTCSICRYRGMRSWRFCPSCGALMRSEEE